jgi:hypothetical protein
MFFALLLAIVLLWGAEALRPVSVSSRLRTVGRSARISKTQVSFFLADGGLDAETLDALGDVNDLNYALDGVIDSTVNPAVGILTKLAASPAILAIPVLAGLLVAVGFGYFIFSYGQGRDD